MNKTNFKQNFSIIINIFIFIIYIFNTGCTTMAVDKTEFEKTKQVAIVGFEIEQMLPNTLDFNLASGKLGVGAQGGNFLPEDKEHAEKIYLSLGDKLQKDLKWSVMNLSDIQKNSSYQEVYKSKMEGWRKRPLMASGFSGYKVKNVMDYWAIAQMTEKERDQLMDKLKVDHLAIARVYVEIESPMSIKNIVGAADLYPKSRMYFYLYKKGVAKSIWYDMAAISPRHHEPIKSFMGIQDIDKMNPYIVSNAQIAINELIDRVQDKLKE
jgi:hypothetical protein